MNGGRVKDKTGVLLMKIAKMIKKSFVLYETIKRRAYKNMATENSLHNIISSRSLTRHSSLTT
jgi:hypothetical protein